jgi:hypothetical protein
MYKGLFMNHRAPVGSMPPTIHANGGMAMIVPVDQLKELLNRKELIQQRDTAVVLVLKGVKP